MKVRVKAPEKIWQDFQEQEQLSDLQLEQFQRYEAFLSQRNQEFNLTAITDLAAIVRQHFADSLSLSKFVTMQDISCIADIGAGAGFPAIPLKIMYPHLKVMLIEVTKKKIQFLEELAELLKLENVEICSYDWRTFLRKTEFKIDLFVTRAALADEELCRAFKPASPYKDTTIVYWAAQEWEAHPKAAEFVRKIEEYKLGSKRRNLVFFGLEL